MSKIRGVLIVVFAILLLSLTTVPSFVSSQTTNPFPTVAPPFGGNNPALPQNPLPTSVSPANNPVVPAQAQVPPSITGFNLINADDNVEQVIGPLVDGQVVDLNTYPEINIEAVTNPSVVGSVRLAVQGPMYRYALENSAPYTLTGYNNGAYDTWTNVLPGNYTLMAVPYPGSGGQGGAGAPYLINFTVINSGVNGAFANAGTDVTAVAVDNISTAVTLNGTGSMSFGGTVSSYTWSQSGVQIATGAQPTVSLPIGINLIDLTVIDSNGNSASDQVAVSVYPGANVLYRINSGGPQVVSSSTMSH